MLKQHLYLQICAVFSVGLVVFTLLGGLIWDAMGHEDYVRELFQRTSALTKLLLPPNDATVEVHQVAVDRISANLDFEVSVYGADGSIIATSGTAKDLSDIDYVPSRWTPIQGTARWVTILDDGRFVAIDLDRIIVPDELLGFGLLLVLLALLMTIVMYPVIRRLTRRLERLQAGVERIGSGELGARVPVEGHDEVSRVALSFNLAAERIEQLVTSQRMLLANASHELRTPLARIRLGIEILKSKDDPARRADLQKDIRELDDLVDELILLSRLDAAPTNKTKEQIDLMALTAEECARYPECEFSGELAEISGDHRMLQHLLRNLLDNAYKHGAAPTSVSVRNGDGLAILCVRDSGSGIPEEMHGQVFEPFIRLAGKQNIPGSGIGLSLVKKIADAHNATIDLSSTDGFQFAVTFPASVPQCDPGPPLSGERAPPA
ncbi:MAG: HAMP domain-containing sensor histidine kinase [Pseudomonadota bacterium]